MASSEEDDLALQMRFCQYVLDELKSPKHGETNDIILPQTSNRDLSGPWRKDVAFVESQLRQKIYKDAEDFASDMRKILSSTRPSGVVTETDAKKMTKLKLLFYLLWKGKYVWLARHASPTITPPTMQRSDNDGTAGILDSLEQRAVHPAPENSNASNARSTETSGSAEEEHPAKRQRLNSPPEPATQPKFKTNDQVFIKRPNTHTSRCRYQVRGYSYERDSDLWRYKVFNADLMGKNQYWSIPEHDMVKPDFDVGNTYKALDKTGDLLSCKVKEIASVHGDISYELEEMRMYKTNATASADKMASHYRSRV